MSNTCLTCEYFSQRDKADEETLFPVKGSCFRFPPQVCIDDKGAFRSQWPKVSSNTHACGEYLYVSHREDIDKDKDVEINKQREKLLKLYEAGGISAHDCLFAIYEQQLKQSNSTN